MKTLVRLTLITLALLTRAHAQPSGSASQSVQWTFALSRPTTAVGEEVELIVTAKIAAPWIVYSSDFQADLGPQPTRFVFEPSDAFQPVGPATSVGPKRKKDKTWDTEFGYFEHRAEFRQKIKILRPSPAIIGRVKGQLCNERDGTCTLFEQAFKL